MASGSSQPKTRALRYDFNLPNPWPYCPGLPRSASAALAALHFGEPRTEELRKLSDREWREALDYCDRSRITLALRTRAGDGLPAWVRQRMDENAARNAERRRRIEALYRELAGALTAAHVEFVALKGISHAALFGGRGEDRVQYDIDLFVPHPSALAARDALLALAYEPVEGVENFPTDHLPTMIRKTSWEWRGDYFDLEIPTPVELHYQLWNEGIERLSAPGTEEFWGRRTSRDAAGFSLAVLNPPDALAYAALHLLKHVLRGSAHPYHVYEIAGFLDSLADDQSFWNQWRSLHAPELRRLEAVVFRLAREWFGGRISPAALEESERLPSATQAWLSEFATAPARCSFDSNKDELWLHWSLLRSRRDAWNVARRRLLPGTLPLLAGANYVPESDRTWQRSVRRWGRYAGHVASRAWHHGVALRRTAASGARWWWHTRGLKP